MVTQLADMMLTQTQRYNRADLSNSGIGSTERLDPHLVSSRVSWNCRDRDPISAQELRRGISLLSLINCFHRIAGAGADIAELVAGARRGTGAPPPDCLALLTSYVTDVFWVEILSRADLVRQLLQQPLLKQQHRANMNEQ